MRFLTFAGSVAVATVLAGCTAAPTPHPDALEPAPSQSPSPTVSTCAPDAGSARLAGKAVLGPRTMIAVDVDTYRHGRLVSTTGHTTDVTPMHVTWDGTDLALGADDLLGGDTLSEQLSAAHLWLSTPDTGHPHDGLTIEDPGSKTYVAYRTAQTVSVPVTVTCDGRTWHGTIEAYTIVGDGIAECGYRPPQPTDGSRLAQKACADA